MTRQRARGVSFVAITSETDEQFVVADADGREHIFLLHDQIAMSGWLSEYDRVVYVDMTSIALRTWAPILRAAVGSGVKLRYVYVEPVRYQRSSGETGDFDLSELTEGISAIPGFARIADSSSGAVPFVPLVGFEGVRLSRIIQRLETIPINTFPIVGVPGFRVEYPFFSYEGNRASLAKSFMHRNVVLARANCPFDAFYELNRIFERLGSDRIQVAPIGTKPHALAAVLFAIAKGRAVDLVYDHPRRAARPTVGVSRICLYFVTEFLGSNLYSSCNTQAAA